MYNNEIIRKLHCSSKSERDTKALMIDLMSSESSSRWCVWHTATEFSRVSDIDVRSQVFSLRRALQLRSAWADDVGDTFSSFTSWPTWSYSARTSGTSVQEPQCICTETLCRIIRLILSVRTVLSNGKICQKCQNLGGRFALPPPPLQILEGDASPLPPWFTPLRAMFSCIDKIKMVWVT